MVYKKYGEHCCLVVRIEIDKDQDFITIKDNAAGIGLDNYHRAFEPANIPLDNSGLHEFGMGMKTAAIWFADIWTVKTKAINEDKERVVEFNLQEVVEKEMEDLKITETPKGRDEHYTEITLRNLSHNVPRGRQLGKIKKHLASIYRNFIRSGDLHLYINGELMTYKDPDILIAPFLKNPESQDIEWKKDFDHKFGEHSVKDL